MSEPKSHSGGDAMHLYVVLSRACQWVSAHAHHDIRKSGLNPTEFGVLEFLYHKGPQPLQQIGEKILISSGNITYVVDKLERKGLVARRASPDDRRVIYADVTDEGRSFMESKFPQHELAVEAAVEGLSPEERQQAIVLLKKLGLAAQQSAKHLT
ncbi:MarR family transcriptional regulator [Gordoniibacillus kamchatkensis]|uniref:MarR family transcriptional regulator n=1 Tax=Gordoniibacillus kamchatkensis TaxID=1590651 RepID=A0ABR5A801_9BACL|nr:MarR family transcriptional regulator [Paenibacillus sp. VKM B-2647]KIL37138.1 MarR family transcriptional regulator [Paenibacillus sp. VKM B-2647]